jgi:hypothetical protein
VLAAVEQGSDQKETKPGTNRGVLVLFLLFVIVVLFSVLHDQESAKPQASRSATRTLRGTYWCGNTFDEAGYIGIAVSHGDKEALAGLLARGDAFQVEGGTTVSAGLEIDAGISSVTIESGSQIGRTCYISTRALQ